MKGNIIYQAWLLQNRKISNLIINWYFTLIMIAGGLIGGYYGASLTRKITQEV
ncbi:hypothetical protein [Flavobacterium sp. Root420]|uniref:hypothetical protein n=1 Tax=Flavobacterium sp. Root420 TaxID=1736533 RepID=UPI000A7807F2|nr:hypothetical protein [Flavobacterium sp. Root420]